MENPKDIRMDLSGIESINNLDTARMSLRWALERLHALEKAKEELAVKADKETAAREKTESEYKALRRSFDVRIEEDEQRDRYYAKMEEMIALQAQGKLDAVSLAKREVETARQEESLKARRVHLEQEHAAKREHLANEIPRLKAEITREAQARVAKLEETLALRRELLESEFSAKNEDLAAREKWFRQAERALAERQKNFDSFSAEQTEIVARDRKNFQRVLEEQTQTRLSNTERLLEERYASKEAAWDRERALILKDLTDWQRKAEERQPRIQDLEKRLSAAQETARWASEAPAREAELRNKIEDLAAARQKQMSDWLAREQELERRLAELQDIKDQLALAEATSRGALAAAAADAERRNKIVQEKTQAFLEKKRELELKLAELGAQRDQLEIKLAKQAERVQDFEKREARQEAAIREKEQALLKREREIEWENANLRGALLSWQEKHQAQIERARELEKEIVQAKEDASSAAQAHADSAGEIQRLKKLLENGKQESLKREEFQERQLALGREELSRQEQKYQAQMSRVADLEKRLADAEEASRRAAQAAALKSHASENTGQLLEQSKREFLKREQFLERQLALGQEELSRKERSLQEQIARASDSASLRDELSLKDKKLREQAAALEDIQKRLAQAQEAANQASIQTAALREELSLKDKKIQEHACVQASNPQELARIAELEKLLVRESERRKKLEAFLAGKLGPAEGGAPPPSAA